MNIIQVISPSDTEALELVNAISLQLRHVAGRPGNISGYVQRHEDGDLSSEFYDVSDPSGKEIDDSRYLISDVVSNDFAPDLFDLANKYPVLTEEDVVISF